MPKGSLLERGGIQDLRIALQTRAGSRALEGGERMEGEFGRKLDVSRR